MPPKAYKIPQLIQDKMQNSKRYTFHRKKGCKISQIQVLW